MLVMFSKPVRARTIHNLIYLITHNVQQMAMVAIEATTLGKKYIGK